METALICGLCVCVIASYILFAFLIREGRMERRELEDRVMSLQAPTELMTIAGLRDREPAEVTYVDEAREAELSPAWEPGDDS